MTEMREGELLRIRELSTDEIQVRQGIRGENGKAAA